MNKQQPESEMRRAALLDEMQKDALAAWQAIEAENERLRERLEELVNTFCSVENVTNEHYLQVLRDAIATLESRRGQNCNLVLDLEGIKK